LDVGLSFILLTVAFAVTYKFLPDAEVRWRSVWVGGLLTAALFVVGKWALGMYFAYRNVGSPFGAAGSLALILIWIYYSGIIVLLGAEFTQVWARRRGDVKTPRPLAVSTGQLKSHPST
jgi:membrane protein